VCTLDFALNTKGVVGAHEAGADDADAKVSGHDVSCGGSAGPS
jgi:hypothetical protein